MMKVTNDFYISDVYIYCASELFSNLFIAIYSYIFYLNIVFSDWTHVHIFPMTDWMMSMTDWMMSDTFRFNRNMIKYIFGNCYIISDMFRAMDKI